MPKRKRPRPIRSYEEPLPLLSGDYNQSLLAYALESRRFDAEANKSKREFWGGHIPPSSGTLDPSMIFWADWFIYCRPLKTGLTPLQTFIKVYQGQLSSDDGVGYNGVGYNEAAYRKLEQSVFGVFQIEQVQRDQSVTVRDLCEELYRQAIGRFHDDHWGHYCLGVLLHKRGQANQAREQYVLALQKAYWQLRQWPGCIDDEIVEEMEGALRDVGGDPASVPSYKLGLWNRLRHK